MPPSTGSSSPTVGLPSKLLASGADGTASSAASAGVSRGPHATWQGAPVSSIRSAYEVRGVDSSQTPVSGAKEIGDMNPRVQVVLTYETRKSQP